MSQSVNLKNATADEMKLKNYRSQLERQNQSEVRELEARHEDQVTRTLEKQQTQLNTLRSAYDVQISKEAEAMEQRLQQIRIENQDRLENEQRQADADFKKLKIKNDQKIREARKTNEKKITELRNELQASTETLHKQAVKSAQRENLKEKEPQST